ncbi:MAG: FkbM family methyltransferase [Candidatus Omnitrophica bacterium]|nr:FkbM family methyltransferase [Candidatus Omnitrophota bacterium]
MKFTELQHALYRNKIIPPILSFLNSVKFPFLKYPVLISGMRMHAHSFDRYLALWIKKINLANSFEIKLIENFCRSGMSAVDIGANIGFYSMMFSRAVGPEGKVWAFEPDPLNFSMLERNLSQNAIQNVYAVNKAAGPNSGASFLYQSKWHTGDHRIVDHGEGREKIPIKILALDEFFADKNIDFIKIDIQGAEGMALEGMKKTLARNPNVVILMEFWPMGIRECGGVPEDVLIHLQDLGFVIENIDEHSNVLEKIMNPKSFVYSLGNQNATDLLVRRPNPIGHTLFPQ